MKSRLTWFVVAAMILGPLFGLTLHRSLGNGAPTEAAAADLSLVTSSFLHLIKMIIAPLVFSTLTVGFARMEGTASIARVGAKTLGAHSQCCSSRRCFTSTSHCTSRSECC